MTDPTWREELAWAAGLFEGEGCFTRSHGVPVANMGMTDLDVIRRFHGIMGFGSMYEMKRADPWKDGLQWMTTTFEQMQATGAMLWPWLGERRRARATEL